VSTLPIVLASTSPFRKELLERLQLPFETFSPQIDETPEPNESPLALVKRLSQLKAQAAKTHYPRALIIGSDQVAVIEGQILGKPGTHKNAVAQLTACSGKQVDLLTGLCLFDSATGDMQVDIIPVSVVFRHLTSIEIESYLQREKAYHCAGSLKSEGLGIALLEKMSGDDPTAIIGLPLIRLVSMLSVKGVSAFSPILGRVINQKDEQM
jgi:septum formation protein